MDSVVEIKARLPIEELVRQYTQLTKKGRNFVALCPFHHDTRPSLLVSPDKGIAYCFPCQKGGDIFSFYQLVENVDFPQALKELAEKTGVRLERAPCNEKPDEKERLRACLEKAERFYRAQLASSGEARSYLEQRGVTAEEIERFGLGLATQSSAELYEHLLKAGCSRREIVAAGLAVQRNLSDERAFDRFRGRILFPIRDVQGRLIGFGGRTIIGDDAKYLNTPDGPLYRKSSVLYGLPEAREAIRERRSVIVVEGYFDVLACHRVGVHGVVATCGTALTEEHARLLRRSADTIILCLDSDRAGRAAAERAFVLLSRLELHVQIVHLPSKDPADTVLEDPSLLRHLLLEEPVSYIESVFREIRSSDASSPESKRSALDRLGVVYDALPTAAEKQAFVHEASPLLGLAETQFEADLQKISAPPVSSHASALPPPGTIFSAVEVTLGLFLLYPRHRSLLQEMIPPEEGMAAALYAALKEHAQSNAAGDEGIDVLGLAPEARERATILALYCEEHDFGVWGESLALREIRRNCLHANRELLRSKQREITERLVEARRDGKIIDEEMLRTQYQQLLKLAQMAR